MQHTISLPNAPYQALHVLHRDWQAILGVVFVAVLASIVTEAVKHKVSLSQEEDRAKRIVRWTLLVTSSGFTAIGYFVAFANQHQSLLSQVPAVGQSVAEVLGAAWTLYNFRLNKTFETVTAALSKWSGGKNPATDAASKTDAALPAESNLEQFQVQG